MPIRDQHTKISCDYAKHFDFNPYFLNLPVHVFPLPRYPVLQVHPYDPAVLAQVAWLEQSLAGSSHSFISEIGMANAFNNEA